MTVYNQLTRGSKSDRNSTEELAGYSKLQKCEGIEVLSNEVHTKLQRFRTLDCQESSRNLKTFAEQGKICTRPIQKSLSVIPMKSDLPPCKNSVLKKNVSIVLKVSFCIPYGLMFCRACIPVFCSAMITMRMVTNLMIKMKLPKIILHCLMKWVLT